MQAKAQGGRAQGHNRRGCNTLAVNGHADVLQLLVQAKADVDKATTDNGATPASEAAHNDRPRRCVQLLVQAKDKATADNGKDGHANVLQADVTTGSWFRRIEQRPGRCRGINRTGGASRAARPAGASRLRRRRRTPNTAHSLQ